MVHGYRPGAGQSAEVPAKQPCRCRRVLKPADDVVAAIAAAGPVNSAAAATIGTISIMTPTVFRAAGPWAERRSLSGADIFLLTKGPLFEAAPGPECRHGLAE